MLRTIRITLKDSAPHLSRQAIALRGGHDRIVWECAGDPEVVVKCDTPSPFNESSFGTGREMIPIAASSPSLHGYTVTTRSGETCRGQIFNTTVKPRTLTITIKQNPHAMDRITVSPDPCRITSHTDEVIWVCEEDSTALIKFDRAGAFPQTEYDAYVLTGPAIGGLSAHEQYKYRIEACGHALDPVIIIDPPP